MEDQERDQEIVNMILGIAPDDVSPCVRLVNDVVSPTTTEAIAVSVSDVLEDPNLHKKKKKKKNGVDFALGVIERIIDILVTAAPKLVEAITPKLLEAITTYLSAGGDPNVEIRGVPLVKVCESHPEVVELLLKYGAMGR